MRKFIYLLTAFDCFAIGLGAVLLFNYWTATVPEPEPAAQIVETGEIATVDVHANDETEESNDPLEQVWEKANHISYLGYQVDRFCNREEGDMGNCSLVVRRGGKSLDRFDSEWVRDNWLQYGLFDFLGTGKKQLIVHTYSGGAHCCYDYVIYDLYPKFRTIYDSRLQDSANDVGNELVPVDLDGDGVYEVRQDVMAFDYWFASHAGSIFPPAIFQYDFKQKRYIVANKKFSGMVQVELRNLGKEEDAMSDPEVSARARILYMLYADERALAWQIFEREYNFPDKQRFKTELKKILSHDPTYRAIYSGH